jgi:acyl-coenzyme A thioesterase PaaI-like protein
MEFFVEDGGLCSETIVRKEHEGWVGIAHGGIVSTILDETMSWAILYFKRIYFVTKNMEVTYVRPLKLDEKYLCRAKVIEQGDPGELKAQAVLRSKEGEIMARSKGRFKVLSREEMKGISERDFEHMEEWFRLMEEWG